MHARHVVRSREDNKDKFRITVKISIKHSQLTTADPENFRIVVRNRLMTTYTVLHMITFQQSFPLIPK